MLKKTDGKDIITKYYPEQNYRVIYNIKTGYFVRAEEKGFPEPLWSNRGPELLDISITNWCDKGCVFCYRNSTVIGKHMPLEDYIFLIEQAKELNVFQVALGGGNPNQHPNFIEILEATVENDIVPCYTTNGRGLSKEILDATKRLCGSVAISAYEPYSEFRNNIEKLLKHDIKANVHFVIDAQSIDTAIEWMENPPSILNGINSIIFLNYKPIGRKPNHDLLLKDKTKIEKFFKLVDNNEHTLKIGFDSCSISGVSRYLNANTAFYEGCDAGRFSAYVDEDLRMFPCSFMTNTDWFDSLKNKSMKEIWQDGEFFKKYRNRIINNDCNSCSLQSVCMGGCPFIEELSLCGWKDERLAKEKEIIID